MIFLTTLPHSHVCNLLRGLYGLFSKFGGNLPEGHAQNNRKYHKVCLEKKQAIKQTNRNGHFWNKIKKKRKNVFFFFLLITLFIYCTSFLFFIISTIRDYSAILSNRGESTYLVRILFVFSILGTALVVPSKVT